MDESSEQLSPATYVQRSAYHLWYDLPLLLIGGLLFALLCVPSVTLLFLGLYGPALLLAVLTVPPSWAALLYLESLIVRGIQAGIGDMLIAIPRFAGRSVLLTLPLSVPLLAFYLILPALSSPAVPAIVWAALFADVLGILVLCALALYAAPLVVFYNVSARVAFRNGMLLAARYGANTVGLLGMGVLLFGVALYLHNALFFLLPAVWSLFVVNNCRLVVKLEEERTAGGTSKN